MHPRVCIIVLCWNGRRWIEACLQSVQKTQYPHFDVLLIDNASTDGSADLVRATFPELPILVSRRNLGFAGGNNLGIQHALKTGADYIVLLNQDTRVDPEWIGALIETAQKRPALTLLSPFQYDYEARNLDVVYQKLLADNTSFFQDTETGTVAEYYTAPTTIGAAMMIHRNTVERLGTFDSVYFAYFEEKDLCRRLVASGGQIGLVPRSKIMHWHGHIHAEESSAGIDRWVQRNRQIFILKDPTRSFVKNLYIYLRYGLPNSLARRYDKNAGQQRFWQALWVQLDVIRHIPRIAWRRWEDKRRIRTVRESRERQ